MGRTMTGERKGRWQKMGRDGDRGVEGTVTGKWWRRPPCPVRRRPGSPPSALDANSLHKLPGRDETA